MECPACDHPNVDGARYCAKCGALLPPPSVDGQDPLIGQVVGGRFRITGLLGEGGMGRVYAGEQQMGTSVRKVAVKTLLTEFSKDPQVVARFMRECGTVVELEHPNTIKFHDFGQTDAGELYIAMEYVDGKDLADAIERGALEVGRVVNIMRQICGSLHEAHDKGVIHRDLKPENVILTTRAGEADFVKVLDFGIAKRSEAADAAKEQKLTQAGMVLGTPPYMSPEQFTGTELNNQSDIYSLGVMAYEMLTGKLPFDATTPWEWATQHMTAQPFPFEKVTELAASIPEHMKLAIMRSLSKEAGERQATAKEFYAELSGESRVTAQLAGTPASAAEGAASGATVSFPTGGGASAGLAGPTGAQAAHGAAAKPGATQIGEPFVPPTGSGPVVGSAPAGSTVPATTGPHAAAGPVPMAPPPRPAPSAGGNKALLYGIIGVVVLGAVIGIAVVVVGQRGDDDDDGPIISLDAGSATTESTASSTEEAADAADDGGGGGDAAAPSTTETASATAPSTRPTTRTTQTKPPSGTAACNQAIAAAMAGQCSAARQSLSRCKGAKRPTAEANVRRCKPKRR